jgi:hypothetical protein
VISAITRRTVSDVMSAGDDCVVDDEAGEEGGDNKRTPVSFETLFHNRCGVKLLADVMRLLRGLNHVGADFKCRGSGLRSYAGQLVCQPTRLCDDLSPFVWSLRETLRGIKCSTHGARRQLDVSRCLQRSWRRMLSA